MQLGEVLDGDLDGDAGGPGAPTVWREDRQILARVCTSGKRRGENVVHGIISHLNEIHFSTLVQILNCLNL